MEFNEMIQGLFQQVRTKSNFLRFLTVLQQNNVSYYIYFVATGNVKIVTTSENYFSMKSHRGLIKINAQASSRLAHLAAKRHFTGMTSFDRYCLELARAGVFKWVVDVEDATRHYWSKDNTLLHTENIIKPTSFISEINNGRH